MWHPSCIGSVSKSLDQDGTMRFPRWLVLVMLASVPFQSHAALVEFNSGGTSFTGGGEGTGRGIGFQALADFEITSIGIFGDLISRSFDAQVWSSTNGNQADSILASATAVVGGNGFTWNDIAIDFSFQANSFYVLHWRPSTGSGWANSIEYFLDSDLPATIPGIANLINGEEGFNATSFSNTLHPNLRVNISTTPDSVPAPASVALLGLALLGLQLRRKA